jgi:hypothetical protein
VGVYARGGAFVAAISLTSNGRTQAVSILPSSGDVATCASNFSSRDERQAVKALRPTAEDLFGAIAWSGGLIGGVNRAFQAFDWISSP